MCNNCQGCLWTLQGHRLSWHLPCLVLKRETRHLIHIPKSFNSRMINQVCQVYVLQQEWLCLFVYTLLMAVQWKYFSSLVLFFVLIWTLTSILLKVRYKVFRTKWFEIREKGFALLVISGIFLKHLCGILSYRFSKVMTLYPLFPYIVRNTCKKNIVFLACTFCGKMKWQWK